MNSGMMRTPMVINARTQTLTSFGTPTYTYASGDTIFGEIKDSSAVEKTNHMALSQVVTHQITTNFYPGIKPFDRFTASLSRGTGGTTISTTFEIVSIVDYKSAGHTLTMQCREVQ
jgi:head-tail adaptor